MQISRGEAATALCGAIGAVAGSFAVAGRTPEFVVAPVAALVVEFSPGVVVTTAIQSLGDWGQRLSFAVATLLAVALFAGVGFAAIRLGRQSEVPYTAAVVALIGGWLLAVVTTGAPKQSLAAAGSLAGVVAVAERAWGYGREHRPSRVSSSRRKVVGAVGALAGFVGLGGYRGWSRTGFEPGPIADVTDEETGAEADRLLERAREQSFDVAGLSGLVTPTEEFYEVDINNVNPNPTDAQWTLTVTGEVDTDLTIGFEELAGMADAVENRFLTLRCVGEPLNGEKTDTALWTGVPVSHLLDRAGVDASGTCCVLVRAVDDYYQEFPLAALEDAFLAFGMNGQRLPRGHGYPVRLLVPGHWGEINVKWLTEIELLDEEQDGYWEKRGWHGTGPVNTVAKLHAVNRDKNGADGSESENESENEGERIEIAGHTYAGTRGIRRVEVSTDDGETWTEAELTDPLPGNDVWRQWRYEWDAKPGKYEVLVRAIDGDGQVQPREFSRAFPSGATGWVSRTIEV